MPILDWQGCFNVRDVGGLPAAGGVRLREGVLIRSDSLDALAPRGWRAAAAAGVVRVVDLRYLSTRPVEPPPDLDVEVRRIELYPDDPEYLDRAREELGGGGALADYLAWQYLDALRTRAPQVAAAVEAVGEIERGATVVHCQAGKDRTGVVVGVILRLAGVPVEAVVEDYVLSASHGRAALERWVEEVPEEAERERRRRLAGAPGEALAWTLAELGRRWGGAEPYLLEAGASPGALRRLRRRLRGEDCAQVSAG